MGNTLRKKKNRQISTTCLYLIAIIGSMAFVLPFGWAISTSLKKSTQLFVFPPEWIPSPVIWQNYYRVWIEIPFASFFMNSVTVTLFAVSGAVFTSSLAAYPFARLRFRGSTFLFMLILSTLMIPPQILLIPRFLIFKNFGWIDTLKPLIVPYVLGGSAFNIFLFRQFYKTIPFELDEAARIDGASSLRIYFNLILPLSKPVFIAISIFSTMFHWNNFIEPLVYLNSTEKFTLALGLNFFRASYDTGGEPMQQLLMAAAIMASLPLIMLFLALQRYLVRGIVMSGVKG